MQSYPFIFSDRLSVRIKRHVIFWICWLIFFGLLYAAAPFLSPLSYVERLPLTMIESLLFLVAHMFLAYTLMYIVLPNYLLKNRYLATAIWVIILFLLTAVISSWISMYLLGKIRPFFVPPEILINRRALDERFFHGLLGGLRGGITIAGLAVAIKLMKHWYTKEQRNLQLQKENAESQLQLLKAQIHPHFLFNTLNNIYSFTQNTSPVASKLVMGLSDMLRYMLYEGSQPFVPLFKELKMLEEYIALEKIRYGNKLDLHIDLPQNTRDLYIAPLLLLPFVENCFKHGISNVLEQPWLNLQVSVKEHYLVMKLLNGKYAGELPADHKHGIGIENVSKRLQLIYPEKHELKVTNEPEVFIVTLKVELEKKYNIPVDNIRKTKILANA